MTSRWDNYNYTFEADVNDMTFRDFEKEFVITHNHLKLPLGRRLNPIKIIQSGPATIVFWNDGSKTVVKRSEDDANDPYAAFCAALAKKQYGSNSRIHKFVDRLTIVQDKKEKEEDEYDFAVAGFKWRNKFREAWKSVKEGLEAEKKKESNDRYIFYVEDIDAFRKGCKPWIARLYSGGEFRLADLKGILGRQVLPEDRELAWSEEDALAIFEALWHAEFNRDTLDWKVTFPKLRELKEY